MAPHIKQSNRSYAEQAQSLHGCDDLNILRNAYPKPDVTATEQEATAYRLPFSQVPMVPVERPLLAAEPKTVTPAEATKSLRIIFMQRWFGFTLHHILFFTVAPMFFSWRNLVLAEIVRFVTTAIGINLCYHRLLTHHSFRCPKVVEYVCALFGAMSGQGPPVEWVSIHRYHHLHCDTPLDPHSPYEGFWWAHMGWIVNKKANVEGPLLDRANATDLTAQPFYRWLEKAWFDLMGLRILLTWWFGGWEMVCWTMTVPLVMSWHSTFFVNSASHIWGSRPYVTGDLSTNNWWVAILAYGEGWHNTHHAMPSSARHGLEWWQFDPTWLLIRGLQAVGLAWDVHLPSEKQLAAKRAPTMGLARSPSSSSRLGSFIPVARNTSVGSDVSGQEEEEAEACGKGGSPLASPARSGSIVSAAASDTSGYSGSDDEGSAHAKVE